VVAVAVAHDRTISEGNGVADADVQLHGGGDVWANWPAYGQSNTVARQGEMFFVGGYGYGFLLEGNPCAMWQRTGKENAATNRGVLTECEPTINRPHDPLPLRDGRTLVLVGTLGDGTRDGACWCGIDEGSYGRCSRIGSCCRTFAR